MNNQAHYSTLEPVRRETNQAGLEVTPDYVPPKADYNHFPVENENVGKGEGKILGLRRRLFFIVAGLLGILVIGAIIGGVVGSTRGKNKSKSSPADAPPSPVAGSSSTPPDSTPPGSSNSTNTTTPSTSTLLDGSKLATVNWTDSKNFQHHALFYQNATGSLTLSLWDSQNKSWATKPVNVPGLQIDPTLNGTALAASVNNLDFSLNIYFYTNKQEIKEFYTRDQQGGSWDKGGLTNKAPVKGYPNSQLAAYNQLCGSRQCCNSTVLLYQDPSQKLRYLNGSDDWTNIGYVMDTAIFPGSGMTLMPLTTTTDPKRLPVSLKAYVENNQLTQEFAGGNGGLWTGGTLAKDSTLLEDFKSCVCYAKTNFFVIQGTTLTTKAQDVSQFSAVPIKNGNQIWSDILVTTLFPNGTVATQWCQDSKWGDTTIPTISGVDTKNYTAIAMNQDQRFYGISSGQIYEYEIGGQTPLSWKYLGVVDT